MFSQVFVYPQGGVSGAMSFLEGVSVTRSILGWVGMSGGWGYVQGCGYVQGTGTPFGHGNLGGWVPTRLGHGTMASGLYASSGMLSC